MTTPHDIYQRFRQRWPRCKRLLLLIRRRRLTRTHRRKLWHEVQQILFGAEWLSWRVEPVREIRKRRVQQVHCGKLEAAHRLLHRWHSLQASVALWLVTSVLLFGSSVVYGFVAAHNESPEPAPDLVSTLVALTGIVGGIAGILFAVIVFGIQFHGERLGQASYLASYFIRREGVVPIAAFSLAVVTANSAVALLSTQGLPHAAVLMAFFNYVLIPTVLLLLLILLYRMVTSVSADIFDRSLVPGLCWEYDRAIDEEIHQAALFTKYERALGAAGLRYSCGAGVMDIEPVAPIRFTMPGKWLVTDVNLSAMREIGTYIRERCPDYEGVVAIGLHDALDDTVAFLLSARRDDQGHQKRDAAPIPDECRQEIDKRLRALFSYRSIHEREIVDVLARFEKTVVNQARHDRADQFERGLGVLERLVESRLERGESWNANPSFWRQRLADMLEGFEYFDMAVGTIESDDTEKVSALVDFSSRMMCRAVKHLNRGLYYRAGELIETTYRHAITDGRHANFVGEQIDIMLATLTSQFAYSRSSWRRNPPKIAEEMPVLLVDLAWRIRLIRAAIEAGRTSDANNFQDRLFMWDQHSTVRAPDPYERRAISAELREACDAISYTDLIVAAWCLRLVEQNHEHADTAKAVYQKCLSDLGTREQILLLWERMRVRAYGEDNVDKLLGITHWALPTPNRVGVSVASWGGDEWIERGFMSVLMARPSSRQHTIPEAIREVPPFRPKPPEDARTLVNSILGNEAVRTELLRIADDKREKAIEEVTALFAERLVVFKRSGLTAVISAPVLNEHCDKLKAQIAKKLEGSSGLADLLDRLGATMCEASSWIAPRAHYGIWLPKDFVVDAGVRDTIDVGLVVEKIREAEFCQATRAAEEISQPRTEVNSLAQLPVAVREAISILRRSSQGPLLAFVPRDQRIIAAIVGGSSWDLPRRGELGNHHLGEWEGCLLAQKAYVDPASIVVMAPLIFFGRVKEPAANRLELRISNPHAEDHDKWLREAQMETDPAKIKESHDVMVAAVMRFAPCIGINDPLAAVRIDLDLSRVGYALLEGEEVYHRQECSTLGNANDKVVFTLARVLRGESKMRQPCDKCHPDKWGKEEEPEASKDQTCGVVP